MKHLKKFNENFNDEYHDNIGDDVPFNHVADIITKKLGYKENTYRGSADWGDCKVWSINSNNGGYTGRFVVLVPENDDEVVLIDRIEDDEDGYHDIEYMSANNLKELDDLILMAKDPDKLKKQIQTKKFNLL